LLGARVGEERRGCGQPRQIFEGKFACVGKTIVRPVACLNNVLGERRGGKQAAAADACSLLTEEAVLPPRPQQDRKDGMHRAVLAAAQRKREDELEQHVVLAVGLAQRDQIAH